MMVNATSGFVYMMVVVTFGFAYMMVNVTFDSVTVLTEPSPPLGSGLDLSSHGSLLSKLSSTRAGRGSRYGNDTGD